MRSSLFWDVARLSLVVDYRRLKQRVGPIFKVQAVQHASLTLEDWTDTLSRNVGESYRATWRNITEE